MNGALRGKDQAEIEKYKDVILYLDSGLEDLPPVETAGGMVLYRGITGSVDPVRFSLAPSLPLSSSALLGQPFHENTLK